MDNVDYNGLVDLFTVEALEEYNKQVFPFRNELLFVNLVERLQEEPTYEVFVPLMYFKQESHIGKNTHRIKVEPRKYLISNLGRVVNCRGKKPEYLTPDINSSGYPEVTIKLSKDKEERLTLSRAVACAFLPLGPEVAKHHPKELQVIHKDGNKLNYALDNLQWVLPPKAGEGTEEAASTGIVGVLV